MVSLLLFPPTSCFSPGNSTFLFLPVYVEQMSEIHHDSGLLLLMKQWIYGLQLYPAHPTLQQIQRKRSALFYFFSLVFCLCCFPGSDTQWRQEIATLMPFYREKVVRLRIWCMPSRMPLYLWKYLVKCSWTLVAQVLRSWGFLAINFWGKSLELVRRYMNLLVQDSRLNTQYSRR